MEVIANNSAVKILRDHAKTLRESISVRLTAIEHHDSQARILRDEAEKLSTLADELDATATRLSA